MPRVVSLNARTEFGAGQTDAVHVVLVTITHPSLPEPARFSTDPTVRFSVDPELIYGTRHLGNRYLFVLLSAVVPDDLANAPPQATLAFANVDRDMAGLLRSVTSPCSVDYTIVRASEPDEILAEFRHLRAVRGTSNAAQVSLDISREPFTSEPCPAPRMTKQRFPALFR